jgi:hypothetical protein
VSSGGGRDGVAGSLRGSVKGVSFFLHLCLLFLSIVHIQIHTHLKWGGCE